MRVFLRTFKVLAALLVIGAAVVFAADNLVPVTFTVRGYGTYSMQTYWIFLSSFLAGAILMSLLNSVDLMKKTLEIRRLNRRLRDAQPSPSGYREREDYESTSEYPPAGI